MNSSDEKEDENNEIRVIKNKDHETTSRVLNRTS